MATSNSIRQSPARPSANGAPTESDFTQITSFLFRADGQIWVHIGEVLSLLDISYGDEAQHIVRLGAALFCDDVYNPTISYLLMPVSAFSKWARERPHLERIAIDELFGGTGLFTAREAVYDTSEVSGGIQW